MARKGDHLVLGTTDQFIGIQGYAGVGKTTQLKAVISHWRPCRRTFVR
jgi:thymidylate kinase